MTPSATIVCKQCKCAKLPSEFYTRKDTGHTKHPCKACISKRGRVHREMHKEEIEARNRRWHSDNKEHVRKQHRQYRTNATGAWTQFSSHKKKGPHELSITRSQFLQWWATTEKICDYCGCSADQQNVVLVY